MNYDRVKGRKWCDSAVKKLIDSAHLKDVDQSSCFPPPAGRLGARQIFELGSSYLESSFSTQT